MAEPATLTLTIAAGDGPIEGVVAVRGEVVEFSGWLELAALIEERRPGRGDVTPPGPPRALPEARRES